MRLRLQALLALLAALALVLAACGSDDDDGAATTTAPGAEADDAGESAAGDLPTIVVTYPILGAAVEDLVGDAATVEVVMPNGVDLHTYQPSAQDVERLNGAELIVANGADLEEGLVDAIEAAEQDGVPVFFAMDHIQARTVGEEAAAHSHGEEEAAHGEEEAAHSHGEEEAEHSHSHSGEDPHFWTDPIAMQEAMVALAADLDAQLGLDLSEQAAGLEQSYGELDAEVSGIVEVVPADQRTLVLDHEAMGYFADRYGFEMVGAIIPSVTTSAEASAGELAELRETIEELGVPTIFVEEGASTDVADAIASEVGAAVMVLPVNVLPDDGSYATFMTVLANTVVEGLTSPA